MPAQMSGIPLPARELPVGTLSVRVVRERMGNNITGQSVSVTSNGETKTATTDAQGRAEFTGFTPGATVVATTTVDGEILVSQEITVPSRGGLRVALVAGATGGRGPGAGGGRGCCQGAAAAGRLWSSAATRASSSSSRATC